MRHTTIALIALLLAACTTVTPPEVGGPSPLADIASFEDCAAAGYPIMESYPEQCRTPDGRTFARDISGDQSSSNASDASMHEVSIPAMMQKDFQGSNLVLGQILADNSIYTRHTITYKANDLTISGIMNIPKGDGPFPLLILNHGFIDPSVYTNGRGLKREQDYLARQGYAVLHPDYRNHAFSDKDPDSDVKLRLAYAEDVIGAILAVQAANMSNIDAERVGMLGHSMGGGVTLNALVIRPDLIDAAVLFAPVSSDARQNFDRWLVRRPEVASKIIENYGSPEDNPEFWDNVSAKNFFDRIDDPIMTHHGDIDDSVPLEWSNDLHELLMQEGKDTTLHVYPGEPHEFIKAWGLVMQRTTEFFDAELKNRMQE